MCADGVPMMLRNRCKPNFFVNNPDRFRRFRMYWPHRHFPCVTKSCVGTTTGSFHPIVLDNFRVTTSLTLLNRRRAEIVFGSLSNDVVFNNGKLNFRFVSTMGSESNGFVGGRISGMVVFSVVVAAAAVTVIAVVGSAAATAGGIAVRDFVIVTVPSSDDLT